MVVATFRTGLEGPWVVDGGVGERCASRLTLPDEALLIVIIVFLATGSTVRAEPDEEGARPVSLTLAARLNEPEAGFTSLAVVDGFRIELTGLLWAVVVVVSGSRRDKI